MTDPLLLPLLREIRRDVVASLLPREMSKSYAIRESRKFLGPNARLWYRNGNFAIGLDMGETRLIVGNGETVYSCFVDAFVQAPGGVSEGEISAAPEGEK